MTLLGFDIGGTKCAVIYGTEEQGNIRILDKRVLPTDLSVKPEVMLDRLIQLAEDFPKPDRVGISCGGPLDSKRGVILSPPNLPGWDHVEIVARLRETYGVPVFLQNDANACAVAEWKVGAGKGYDNVIFLTFGSGLGAGLILDGHLYAGTNDYAGEAGHIRLEEDGPEGYHKKGSFEGFCSGNGIGKLGQQMAEEARKNGVIPSFDGTFTAKTIAEAADKGDPTAIAVFQKSAQELGKGLSILIDILNPQVIIIGSVFTRAEHLLRDGAEEVIRRETLEGARQVCKLVPASLGEHIGDYAALCTALL